MREPLVLPALGVAAGIICGRALGLEIPELIAGIAGSLLLAGVAFAARAVRAGRAALLAATVLAGCWTVAYHARPEAPRLDTHNRELAVFSGCVVSPSSLYQDREQFVLELEAGARARVNVYAKDGIAPPELAYGQRVEFVGLARAVRNFANPGAFDYQTYLARSSIFWNISARLETMKLLAGRCGSPFWGAVFGLRTAALRRLESLYLGDAYATGMMQAVLIGDDTKLERVWTENFRRTGTYHALVISGLHISVLAGCLLFLLRICGFPELPAMALTCLAAWLYALVSGFTAPVVRAAGGFTLFLMARFFYRGTRTLNLVAAVTLAYLLCDPDQLTDASFQLSFLSVVAIGALAVPLLDATTARYARGLAGLRDVDRDPHFEPKVAQFRVELRLMAETLAYWLRLPSRVWLGAFGLGLRGLCFVFELVTLSMVVQIGLALPMAVYFHRISFSGLSANVIIVPLMTGAVPVGFAAIFTGFHWVARAAGLLLEVSRRVADFHAALEPNWRVPDPPEWLGVAFAMALIALAVLARGKSKWWPAALASVGVLFALVIVHPFAPRIQKGALELTAIDVGQGEALFLALPDGHAMMVDGGGFPAFGARRKPSLDIGEDVVAPYLWSRSIRRLDVLVSTHGHEDHLGGLPALAEGFHPKELWSGATVETPAWKALRERAAAQGMKLRELRAGTKFDYGGASFEVLSPGGEYQAGPAPVNNDSLVMRVTYGRHSLLLTGDAEWPMEEAMLRRGLPRVDILKVAHHGSRTSSTEAFLAATHPTFALISAGFENSFGLPHPDVIGRLGNIGVELFRTDEDGLVTFRTDGRRITAEAQRMFQAR